MSDNTSEATPRAEDARYEHRTVQRYILTNVEDVERKYPDAHDIAPNHAGWEAVWEDMNKLVDEIDNHWPEGVSAVNTVSKQRRGL